MTFKVCKTKCNNSKNYLQNTPFLFNYSKPNYNIFLIIFLKCIESCFCSLESFSIYLIDWENYWVYKWSIYSISNNNNKSTPSCVKIRLFALETSAPRLWMEFTPSTLPVYCKKNNFSNIIWENFWSILLFQVVF